MLLERPAGKKSKMTLWMSENWCENCRSLPKSIFWGGGGGKSTQKLTRTGWKPYQQTRRPAKHKPLACNRLCFLLLWTPPPPTNSIPTNLGQSITTCSSDICSWLAWFSKKWLTRALISMSKILNQPIFWSCIDETCSRQLQRLNPPPCVAQKRFKRVC